MKRWRWLYLLPLLWPFLEPGCQARGQPSAAVVKIATHGASATVIATGPGWTYLLGCAHAYEGQDRWLPMAVDMPVPYPADRTPHRVGVKLIALDERADLSLVYVGAGPAPYCCPVKDGGRYVRECLSVGYDEMRTPAQVRKATLIDTRGQWYTTREAPWHGRSGGALIGDGYLIGVVSGYECDGIPYRPGTPAYKQYVEARKPGMYVAHSVIVGFLKKHQPQLVLANDAQPTPAAPTRPYVAQAAPQRPPALALPQSIFCPPGKT